MSDWGNSIERGVVSRGLKARSKMSPFVCCFAANTFLRILIIKMLIRYECIRSLKMIENNRENEWEWGFVGYEKVWVCALHSVECFYCWLLFFVFFGRGRGGWRSLITVSRSVSPKRIVRHSPFDEVEWDSTHYQ
jgi:hypothetical protein